MAGPGIVRELVYRLGLSFDRRSGLKTKQAAQSSLGGLQGLLKTFSVVFAVRGVKAMANMASSVVENLNVMKYAFEENQADVMTWSKTFAEVASRSQYEMQKMAGDLGMVLNPLMGGNSKAAAEMSMRLSEIAVDMASFANKRTEDVLIALRAGIVGETEPLRRLGVVMTQDALQAFALSEGLNVNIKSMDNASKTALRYQFILANTTLAQGDAARTAHEYENLTKANASALKDLGITVGLFLLPYMKKLMVDTKKFVLRFTDWIKKTKALENILAMAGIAAGLFAVKMLLSAGPLLLTLLIYASLLAVLEDLYRFFVGDKSAIGEFVNLLYGPGSAAQAAQDLKITIDDLKRTVGDFFRVLESGGIPKLKLFGRTLQNSVAAVFGVTRIQVQRLINFINIFFTKLRQLTIVPDFVKDAIDKVKGKGAGAAAIEQAQNDTQEELSDRIELEKSLREELDGYKASIGNLYDIDKRQTDKEIKRRVIEVWAPVRAERAYRHIREAAEAKRPKKNPDVVINQENNINLPTQGLSERQVKKAAELIKHYSKESAKAAAAALTQGAR